MRDNYSLIKWGYAILFIILSIIGVCLIALNQALVALAITIGCILASVGIVLGVLTVAKREHGFSFAMRIIFSAVCLIAGVVVAVFNAGAVEIIISVSSLLLIIDASFKINTVAMCKRYSVSGWWLLLPFSVAIITTSFFLIKYTPESINAASVTLGIVFIVDALANLFSSFFNPAYERRMSVAISFNTELSTRNTDERSESTSDSETEESAEQSSDASQATDSGESATESE